MPSMRAVVQRVSRAEVRVDGRPVGAVGSGLVVLVGVTFGDTEADAMALADKIAGLRIFADEKGAMNLSVSEVGGSALVVSQFTLYADARKGRRPSFLAAAAPAEAKAYYEAVAERLRLDGVPVSTGEFQAMMQISLVNDGPVTILLDSRRT